MKLYTEEQVVQIVSWLTTDDITREDIKSKLKGLIQINALTPIELPSDEEIYELTNIIPFSKHIGDEPFNNGQRKGFELGIKYIRHQILNQNK
jgi:hypothetical protein